MPVPYYHHLEKRSDSGTIFSIIFGVVAASVVVVCAIWGYLIPKWKKKHLASPSRSEWEEGILTSRRSRRLRSFPSHPTIKPLLSKPSTAQILPTYNPRVESPFPDRPEPGLSLNASQIVPRTYSAATAPTVLSSNGLFTPVRGRNGEDGQYLKKYHTVPRATKAKHFPGKSSDFGDAKDFILAVPEPLVLKPRDAGRPPAVTRHLEKYGAPRTSSPASSDKLPHPNKLFRAIQGGDVRSSLCSSTTMHVDHRQSDAVAASGATEVNAALDQAIQEDAGKRIHYPYSSDESSKASSVVRCSPGARAGDEGSTAVHRLRSYRSLTGSQPSTLARAGTLTRPKTPVDILRKFYGQEQRNVTMPLVALPQMPSTSTMLTMHDNSSEVGTISTTATSPTLPPTYLKLFPAPLYCHRSASDGSAADHSIVETAVSKPGIVLAEHKLAARTLHCTRALIPEKKRSRGFYLPGRRSKPVPASIQVGALQQSPLDQPRRSMSDFGHAVMAPVIRQGQLRSRARASSMYSRDTHGSSLAPSPSTPRFASPKLNVFGELHATENPFQDRQSVKTRINEWNQRLESNASTPLPLSKQNSPIPPILKNEAEPVAQLNSMKENDESVCAQIATNEATLTEHDSESCGRRSLAPGGATWI